MTKEWKDHRGPVLDSVNDFDVIECETCRFRHIIPIPTPEEMERVYREEYYSLEKPLYLERHTEDVDWWYLVYGERYDVFEAHLPAGRRRILDVGSGPGYFLKAGAERGWDTLGIEPSRQAAEHSRSLGLEIVEEFLSEENVDELGRFDVVHMHEVLEHIGDPLHMLTLARRLLAPGGILCVIVPNDYNPFQAALRQALSFAPWWVAPPHHVNYFDATSLETLVRGAGFETLHGTSTFPMELFLLMGDNYVGNDEVGRAMHARRKHLEVTLERAGKSELKQEIYRRLAELGLGREAVIYARRSEDGG